MLKSNEENIIHFSPKKSVNRDCIITLTTLTPFAAIGIPFLFIFDMYPDIDILLKIVIIATSFILAYSFTFFGLFFGPPPMNEAIITVEGITRKKFWLKRTILWMEITKMDEVQQIGLQRSFGERFFTIYSRKGWITFCDKIRDYKKLKDIIMERAEAKYFKHNVSKWGEEWVK